MKKLKAFRRKWFWPTSIIGHDLLDRQREITQTTVSIINPLPLLFKSLPGQEDCVFFQWAFKFTCKTRNRNPYREKNYNN
jgi:hypothetical protein